MSGEPDCLILAPSTEIAANGRLSSFCQRGQVSPEIVEQATRLIRKFFGDDVLVRLAADADPESGEDWIQVTVTTKQVWKEARAGYLSFIREWVATTRWPERDRIRVSYFAA